jgi:hypothetical protein
MIWLGSILGSVQLNYRVREFIFLTGGIHSLYLGCVKKNHSG